MMQAGAGSGGTIDSQAWKRWFRLRRDRGDSDRANALLRDDQPYLSLWATNHALIHDLFGLERLAQSRCVVLLGESGLGKSWAMAELQRCVPAAQSVIVSLQLCHSVSDLAAKLQGTGSEQVIFLDGLEESRFAEQICAALSEQFGRELPKVRLAVRSAAWRGRFERELEKIWQPEVFELCPLLRSEVQQSLTEVSRSCDWFTKLEAVGAKPLLARPVTLLLILKLIRMDKLPDKLPDRLTRRSLYQHGMRELVTESNCKATKSGLTRDERLAAARRTAAITVWCARPSFDDGGAGAEIAEGLGFDQLADGSGEPTDDNGSTTRPLLPEHFEELGRETGLFRRDGDVTSWVHASFAEFLAADYILLHKVPFAQLRSSLGLSSGSPPPLQLEGVLGWLAETEPKLRAELLGMRPQILLQAATVVLTDDERHRVVDHLLREVEQEREDSVTEEVLLCAESLRHPRIAAQLREWLVPEQSLPVALSALRLIRAIGVRELVDELVELTLDPEPPERVRIAAAACVVDHGSPEQKARLLAFLAPVAAATEQALDSDDDPRDALRGLALTALWPNQLTPEQLFAALTPPRRTNYTGPYQVFVHQLIVQLYSVASEVLPEVLDVALQWARELAPVSAPAWPNDLVQAIVARALRHPDMVRWADPLLDIMVAYHNAFSSLRPVMTEGALPGQEMRRTLVARLVGRLEACSGDKTLVSTQGRVQGREEQLLRGAPLGGNGLVVAADDLPWLLARAGQATSARSWWLHALHAALPAPGSVPTASFEQLWQLCDPDGKHGELRARGGGFFDFFEVEIPAQQPMVERAQQADRDARQRADDDRVATISAVANGSESDFQRDRHLVPCDHAGLGGRWYRLPAQQRSQLADRALAWLQRSDAVDADDLWCVAVVVAERRLDDVHVEGWRRLLLDPELSWLPLRYEHRQEIGKRILRHCGEELADRISAAASPQLLRDLSGLLPRDRNWPEVVVRSVLAVMPSQSEQDQLEMLESLPPRNFAAAQALAQSLTRSCDAETPRRTRQLLLAFGDEASKRAVLEEAFQRPGDPQGRRLAEGFLAFGSQSRTSMYSTAEESESREVLYPLFPPMLAAIAYLWLVREYPLEDSGNDRFPDRYGAGLFRDQVFGMIQVGPPDQVIAAIQHVLAVLPAHRQLRAALERAHRTRASQLWDPPKPTDWLSLMRNSRLRRIACEDDLAEVVMESIARFSGHLQGETAEAESLWNDSNRKQGKRGRPKPKREEALSNALARHLRRDLCDHLVIIHREVEVRPGKNSQMGRKTDVHVDATDPQIQKKLQLIIEVKRCIEKGWKDIDGQLVKRYLIENLPCAGIFLVGYYDCGCPVCKKYSQDEVQGVLQRAAQAIGEHRIRTNVLNCRYPSAEIHAS
jgi:hypothetical protein